MDYLATVCDAYSLQALPVVRRPRRQGTDLGVLVFFVGTACRSALGNYGGNSLESWRHCNYWVGVGTNLRMDCMQSPIILAPRHIKGSPVYIEGGPRMK